MCSVACGENHKINKSIIYNKIKKKEKQGLSHLLACVYHCPFLQELNIECNLEDLENEHKYVEDMENALLQCENSSKIQILKMKVILFFIDSAVHREKLQYNYSLVIRVSVKNFRLG